MLTSRQNGQGMATQMDEECCTGFSLPYDGITRTGSKGLSQLHRNWCGTPNDNGEVTGIAVYKQGLRTISLRIPIRALRVLFGSGVRAAPLAPPDIGTRDREHGDHQPHDRNKDESGKPEEAA